MYGQLHASAALTLGEERRLHIQLKAGLAPESVWTFQVREFWLIPRIESRFVCRPSCSPDTVPSALYRLLHSQGRAKEEQESLDPRPAKLLCLL